MFLKDKGAQVSIEYLLTIVFGIILVAIVTIFAFQLRFLGNAAKERIAEYKNEYFQKLFD